MKTMKSILSIVLLITVFQTTNAAVTTVESSDSQMQKDILTYVNQYRVQHHLKPLQSNAYIVKEAVKHSHDMATHKVPFGHKYFPTRIKHLYADLHNCRGGAENVAYNYKTARIVVDGWLKSPGHRRNIDGNYNLTGIGIARDTQGKPYFTQIFIRTDNSAKSH